jgi:hypothetical protein
MFRNVVNLSLFSSKSMLFFKSSKAANPQFYFNSFFPFRKFLLPPMKLLTNGVHQKPPPFYPDPTNYSFLVALCFGFLVIFNRK